MERDRILDDVGDHSSMDRIDVYRAANLLIQKKHGEDAVIEAAIEAGKPPEHPMAN